MKTRKMKKWAALSMTSLMAVSVLAGCGGDSDPGEKKGGEAASGKTEIVVWTRDSAVAAVKSAAKKYNEQNENVEVKVVEQPASQMADQLSLALSSGEAPDIVSLDCTKVPYFASIGAFADISDKYEALDYKDAFSEGMIKSGQLEGKTYAVPFAPDVSVLLYNKDQYQEAGLDPETPPKTWEELIDYSQKLTTADRYGYVYAGGDAGGHMFTFMPYVWNNGGEVLSEDGKTCELDSENAVAALSMFNDLTNTYKVTPPSVTTYSWNEAQDAFLTGKASQVVLGSAAIYSFISGEHGDMNWGACLLPKGPDGTEYASFSGGDSIGVTSQCKDVDAAWEFIQFSLSKEVQVDELAKGGLLPARSDFFDNEYFNNTPEYQVLKEALEVGHTPVSLKYDEMYVPILEAMQTCLNGEKTPEQAFKDAAEAINKIMQ
ncbi:ABC transporter substrate-binding protein [Blautia producta]|uniref:ABC transporter substrate-binding protein n=1 Tax=Blautia producta TaxID=33035 RepID=UPI0036F1C9B3